MARGGVFYSFCLWVLIAPSKISSRGEIQASWSNHSFPGHWWVPSVSQVWGEVLWMQRWVRQVGLPLSDRGLSAYFSPVMSYTRGSNPRLGIVVPTLRMRGSGVERGSVNSPKIPSQACLNLTPMFSHTTSLHWLAKSSFVPTGVSV